MKKINVNLQSEIEKYDEEQEIKDIATSLINLLNDNRSEEHVKIEIERKINNLVK